MLESNFHGQTEIMEHQNLWLSTETFWSMTFMIWPWKYDSRFSVNRNFNKESLKY